MDTLIRVLIIACLLVGLLDLVLLAIILWTRYVKGTLVVLEARMGRMKQEREDLRKALEAIRLGTQIQQHPLACFTDRQLRNYIDKPISMKKKRRKS